MAYNSYMQNEINIHTYVPKNVCPSTKYNSLTRSLYSGIQSVTHSLMDGVTFRFITFIQPPTYSPFLIDTPTLFCSVHVLAGKNVTFLLLFYPKRIWICHFVIFYDDLNCSTTCFCTKEMMCCKEN